MSSFEAAVQHVKDDHVNSDELVCYADMSLSCMYFLMCKRSMLRHVKTTPRASREYGGNPTECHKCKYRLSQYSSRAGGLELFTPCTSSSHSHCCTLVEDCF